MGGAAGKLTAAARALCQVPPSDEECLPGLTPEDFLAPMPLVWPENATIVEVFQAVGETQWARGPDGRPVGLRYEALPVVMDFLDVPAGERREVFEGVRVMEAAGLAAMRE